MYFKIMNYGYTNETLIGRNRLEPLGESVPG